MTPRSTVHIHVRPRLRSLGEQVVPDWLAITLGSHIWAWRLVNRRELAHELAHVRQWRRHRIWFPLLYLAAAAEAWRAGRDWYRDNRFEREATRPDGSDGPASG